MSRWRTQFKDHEIHETLKTLKNTLNLDLANVDSTAIAEISRIRKIASAIEIILERSDPELFPINDLNQLNSAIKHPNFLGKIQQFSSSQSHVNFLVEANNNIETQQALLRELSAAHHTPQTEKEISDLHTTFEQFTGAIDNSASHFSDELEEMGKELSLLDSRRLEMKEKIDQQSSDLSERLDQWQNQFTDAQSKRADNFTSSEEERRKASNDKLREQVALFESDREAARKEYSSRLDELFIHSETALKEVETDAQEKHKTIQKLYGLVADDSVTGGYKSLADHERRQANIWRSLSIVFIIATSAWIAATYILGTGISDDPGQRVFGFLKSISVSAVLLFGAVYSSKQSSLHRIQEQRTRWFSLEVNAIDPFISSLDVEQQKKLKEAFSERLFANGAKPDTGSEASALDPNMFKLFGNVAKDIVSAARR